MSKQITNVRLLQKMYIEDTHEAAKLSIIFSQDVEDAQRQLYFYGEDVEECIKVRMHLLTLKYKLRLVEMTKKDTEEYTKAFEGYMREYLGYRQGTTLKNPKKLLQELKRFEKKWVGKYGKQA